jgi:hypothetical protein
MTDVVIIFALDEELRNAYGFLKRDGEHCEHVYDHGTFKSYLFHHRIRHERTWSIRIATIREQGNLEVATSVQSFLTESPTVVIMAGIAGSLDVDLANFGDVVVASSVKSMMPDGYKTIKPGQEVFSDDNGDIPPGAIVVDSRDRLMSQTFIRHRRRWLYLEESHKILDEYLASTRDDPPNMEKLDVEASDGSKIQNLKPKLVTTTILGSEFVVDSHEYVGLLHERNQDNSSDYYARKGDPEDSKRNTWRADQMVAVDMETFGFILAMSKLARPKTLAFAVRGISDDAKHKSKIDSTTGGRVRELAAKNATAVALDLASFVRKHRYGK